MTASLWMVVGGLLSLAVISAEAATHNERISIMKFTDRVPGADDPGRWVTWTEGPDDTILMSFNCGGESHIASSSDEGRSWQVFSTVEWPEVSGRQIGWGFFTRLSETALLLRAYEISGEEQHRGQEPGTMLWVRSDDNGLSWSGATPIASGIWANPAPIRVMSDGKWLASGHRRRDDGALEACLLWSGDKGKTWGEPITFPTPQDSNQCLSESDVLQLGPNEYVAAIRSDEGHVDQGWDGFYLAWSEDGHKWSVPISTTGASPPTLRERGRQPTFYRLGSLWALSYRLYDHPLRLQHGAIRFSRDGKAWSPPMLVSHRVGFQPFIVQVRHKVIVFSTCYRDQTHISRHDITALLECLQKPVK